MHSPSKVPIFHIERHQHGWLVFGNVPIGDFQSVARLVSKGGVLSPGIANHYRATLCVAEVEDEKAWRKEIEELLRCEPPEVRFIRGVHTGISSKTIFVALTNNESLRSEAARCLTPDHPHDSDDFSRCYRLLQMIPEWEARLPEVGVKFPKTAWSRLAVRWAELKADFEVGRHREVTRKIREIIES